MSGSQEGAPGAAARERLRKQDTLELVDAWERRMTRAERELLLEELRSRRFRIQSLPAPPADAAAPDRQAPASPSVAPPEGGSPDWTGRVIGLTLGGLAGALATIALSTYGGVPIEVLLGLPGVGLSVGSGLFSRRRSLPWGVAMAGLGWLWTCFVVWLRAPSASSLPELAAQMTLSDVGLAHAALVLAVGLAVGSGWKQS